MKIILLLALMGSLTLYTVAATDQLSYVAKFSTAAACQNAVDASKSGFICSGQTLYTAAATDAKLYATKFSSAAACQSAVDAASH